MNQPLRRTLALAGLALSFSACGDTSPPVAKKTAPQEVARDVRTELPAGVQVRDVSPEGIPSFVQGPLGRMSPELTGLSTSAVDASLRGALPGVAKLFRLDAAQLVFKRVQQDAFGNTFVRYGQTKNGLPVVNAELLLHVNREGEIFAANGNAHDGSRLASVPTLSEAAALATAREDATRSGSSVRGEPRLVYLRSSLDQALYLAYELRVAGGERDGLPVDELLFVNAQDGALVERHSRIHAALNRRVSSAMNGNSLPGTLKRTEGQAVTGDTFVDGHYDRLGEFYNCYRNNFGRDSYDNAGAALLSTVHYRSNYVNIFWDGTQLVLGDGDNVEARALPLDPDFVTHELTHAVIERTSNLIYSGQSGGLNESLSDILAAFCQSYNSGTWSTSNEVFMIGEASWTPNIPNDALRYLYDPTKDGVSRDFFSGALSNVDPHYSSGVSNLAFTLLARGGWHPKHRSNVNVTGIGVEKAGHIFYEANANCFTSGTTFSSAKACTEAKATQLYGATVAASVTQAWLAVGMGGNNTPSSFTCANVEPLTSDMPITGLSASAGSQNCYTLNLPPNSINVKFEVSGGTGDVDLYVRSGALPSPSTHGCASTLDGNAESCTFSSQTMGIYYVVLDGFMDYSGVRLVATYETSEEEPPAQGLSNGVATNQYSGTESSWTCFTLNVPSGSSSVVFSQTGSLGDADMYVKRGARPTLNNYDCRPYQAGNNETCTLPPTAGTYHVCSYGYQAFSGVTMKGTYY